MPNARVSHDAVGLAGASASYHRGGWEDRAARSAVNAAATSAERGAQAVHRDPGREAQGSLDQPNERTSALKRALGRRVGYSPWSPSRPDNGVLQLFGLYHRTAHWLGTGTATGYFPHILDLSNSARPLRHHRAPGGGAEAPLPDVHALRSRFRLQTPQSRPPRSRLIPVGQSAAAPRSTQVPTAKIGLARGPAQNTRVGARCAAWRARPLHPTTCVSRR